MGKNEKTPIDIDGKPYYYEDLTKEQQQIVNHLADLDRKIGSTAFNLDQLTVGKNAFVQMLKQSLEAAPESVEGSAGTDTVQ